MFFACYALKPGFRALHAGRPIPEDLEVYSGSLFRSMPNTLQFVMTMLEVPDRAAEFLSMNCADGVVQDAMSSLYFTQFANPFDLARLSGDPLLRQLQCLGASSVAKAENLERCG